MNINWRKLSALTAAIMMAFVAACSDDDDNNNDDDGDDDDASRPLLSESLTADERFSTFVSLLDANGITASLQGDTTYTVFAPTNEAFERFPAGALDSLGAAQAGVLQYHIVPGRITRAQLTDGATFTTVQGETITIRRISDDDDLFEDQDDIFLDGIVLVNDDDDDVRARNGQLFAIDAVMLPPSVAFPGTLLDLLNAYPSLSSLRDAVVNAGLEDTLSGGDGLTVLAPTNQGFTTVPDEDLTALLDPANVGELASLITYHTIPGTQTAAALEERRTVDSTLGPRIAFADVGGTLRANDALAVRTDFQASNGILHAIEGVLTVPGTLAEELDRRDDLSNFTRLMDEQGLRTSLEGEGETTVFAFTDDAFDAFSAIEDDAAIENIMANHLLLGLCDSSVLAERAADGTPLVSEAAAPNEILVIGEGDALTLNGVVQFTRTDVIATNGVIHIIDAVILPANVPFPGTLADAVGAYSVFSTLNAALDRADLMDTLREDNEGVGFTLFAPTNAAFVEAGITDVDAVAVSTLNTMLLNHVVPGQLLIDDLLALPTVVPVGGGSTTVAADGSTIVLDGNTTVIAPNIQTSNGIMHVIDNVLMP